MAAQVGLCGSENPPSLNRDQNPLMQKGVGGKCYIGDSAQRIERYPDFKFVSANLFGREWSWQEWIFRDTQNQTAG